MNEEQRLLKRIEFLKVRNRDLDKEIRELKAGTGELKTWARIYDDLKTFCVDLWYPQCLDQGGVSRFDRIEVGLIDTRVADSIQVSYDFERDGFVIKQASRFSWLEDEIGPNGECDSDWQEVAFVEAWARAEEDEDGMGFK